MKFQHDFKELARTHSEKFVKRTGRDSEETFQVGMWLCNILNSENLKIKFWNKRKTKISVTEGEEITESQISIPDKSLLFQYLFINETDEMYRMEQAFRIANGYDDKYFAPKNLENYIYEPFGNTCFYISKTGMSYVVSNDGTNYDFLITLKANL